MNGLREAGLNFDSVATLEEGVATSVSDNCKGLGCIWNCELKLLDRLARGVGANGLKVVDLILERDAISDAGVAAGASSIWTGLGAKGTGGLIVLDR